MSLTLTLTGSKSLLHATYFPPIELEDGNYECGLVDFQCYNSIPNVDERNNLFHFVNDNKFTIICIPTGSYEVIDILKYLENALKEEGVIFKFEVNKNTFKTILTCDHLIDFSQENSVGSVLGFDRKSLLPNVINCGENIVDINTLNVIRIECNVISGAYLNNERVHTIHEFSPIVSPGYKIVEVPKNIIYLPVFVKAISSISISLVDQNNTSINFRGELITIRLHIRKRI